MSESISVLIVDDNPSMARGLADVLDAKGFIAYPASSGAEALGILGDHPVDVLLTDIIMQGMNGLALYRETRKSHSKLTTIFMTAYAADDLIQKGMAEGIKTVLTKPLDMDLLLLILTAIGRNSNKTQKRG